MPRLHRRFANKVQAPQGRRAPKRHRLRSGLRTARLCGNLAALTGAGMKHYRVNKLDRHAGSVVKRKDILANNDKQAVEAAARDQDCPICEILHAGEKVGSID